MNQVIHSTLKTPRKIPGGWRVSGEESANRPRPGNPMLLVPLFAFVLATSAPGAAEAAPEPAVIAAARAEGLPVELLEAKWQEAQLKRVSAARATPVLEGLAEHLRAADRLLEHRGTPGRDRVVSSVALALAAGAEPVSLGQALKAGATASDRELGAQAVAALVLAKVPAADAARLVATALREGLADRLLSVRPAVEMLRGAGYDEREVLGRVERALTEGRPPLDAVGSTQRERIGPPPHARGQGNAAPDRDRSDRAEKSGRTPPPGSGGKGKGQGNGQGKGKGRP